MRVVTFWIANVIVIIIMKAVATVDIQNVHA